MNRYKSSGFTLIELMIVTAIIAILAAVSLGFYGNYVTRAARTDARTALTSTAASLEKCRSIYGAYNHASCNVTFPVTSDEAYYSIAQPAAANLAASTFTLIATPMGRQLADTECDGLSLTNTGLKSGTGTDPTKCW